MPNTLMPHAPQTQPLAEPQHFLQQPAPLKRTQVRQKSMQELLGTPSKAEAIHEAEDVPEMMAVPGIFLGLRVALLFNLGLCIAAAVGYEVWTIATK